MRPPRTFASGNRAGTLLALCVFVAALPALGAGVKTHVDYDRTASFGEYTTFQFHDTRYDLRRVSLSLHQWVARGIIGHARAGGLAYVPSAPDVYLAYYAAYQGDLRLVPEDLKYAYGDGFVTGTYWQGGGGSHDAGDGSFTFARGALVVDVWDRQRGVLVWRGTAPGALKKDYQKSQASLAKAIVKLMKRWEEMYGERAPGTR